MKGIRKHPWMNLCFLILLLFSGLGSDYIQGSSVSPETTRQTSTLVSPGLCAHGAPDICSSDQLGRTVLQRNSGELKLERGQRGGRAAARTSLFSDFAGRTLLYSTYLTASPIQLYQSSTHQLMVFMDYIHRQDGEKSSFF